MNKQESYVSAALETSVNEVVEPRNLLPNRRPIQTKFPLYCVCKPDTQNKGIFMKQNLTKLAFILDCAAPWETLPTAWENATRCDLTQRVREMIQQKKECR